MINYKQIAASNSFYEARGYQQIETPWIVPESTSNITRAVGAIDFKLQQAGKIVVNSGEQGFLDLMLKGYLPKGMYQTTTPCFVHELGRDIGITHKKFFMQTTLIMTDIVTVSSLTNVIAHAFLNFETLLPDRSEHKLEILPVENTETFSIELNGLEIGSYGIRSYTGLSWIYGTGIVEPRFSTAMFSKK